MSKLTIGTAIAAVTTSDATIEAALPQGVRGSTINSTLNKAHCAKMSKAMKVYC